MSWRDASACRFHRRHVDRLSPTTSTTDPPSLPIVSSEMSSARGNRTGSETAAAVRAHLARRPVHGGEEGTT